MSSEPLKRVSMWSTLILWLYAHGGRRTRSALLRIVRRTEGGEFRSTTLRLIYAKHLGVEIGMYTHGGCFEQWAFDPHTTIGRYCSIASGVRAVNHNHPLAFKSTSGLFFNPALGYCNDWLVGFNPLVIGNDVWIGANAVILPEVNHVGDGAVIGAGAVVSRDVPPFAVVLGNPARVVKRRFPDDQIAALLQEKWWQHDLDDLPLAEFQKPLIGARGDPEPPGDR